MASPLRERVSRWLAGRYYTFRERCSRKGFLRPFLVVLYFCLIAYTAWLLPEFGTGLYNVLLFEFLIVSVALFLVFSVLGCYARFGRSAQPPRQASCVC